VINDKIALLRPDVIPARPSTAARMERVAEQLRERIVGGSLRRGQPLACNDLMREFGVSAAVLREALALLCLEGYGVRSGRRIVVAPLCLEARQLLKRRLSLELHLTRLAAKRITPFGLRQLERLQQEMVEAQHRQDLFMVRRCNYRFHTSLYRFADRPDLVRDVQTLWASFPFDLMTTMPQRLPAVADEHAAVLQMLRQGDVRRAGRAMRSHILQGWQEFQRHYPFSPARAAGHAG
jgi:DNA-binding GntR family transcriptional regulator